MEQSCPPSTTEDSAPPNPNPNPNKDHFQYLNQLSKFSHKISKPPIRKPSSSFDHLPLPHQSILIDDDAQSQPSNLHHQQQPPVYNINKNDFRDVVQKLTGSPAHERLSSPPPIQPPKPPSSRLQRIRPPPLEHLSNRPPPLLNDAVALPLNPIQPVQQPFSPLPPLPAVHAAAESPISAYMRYLHTSSSSSSFAVDSDSRKLSGLSPRFGQPPAPNNSLPSPTSGSVPPLHFSTASSPLPFGCLPSPYPLLSPGSLFSAVNQFGFRQLPFADTACIKSALEKSLRFSNQTMLVSKKVKFSGFIGFSILGIYIYMNVEKTCKKKD